MSNYQPIWKTYRVNSETWWQQNAKATALFRKNRFGQNAEILNIQWEGPLAKIKSSLSRNGWKNIHTRGYLSTLKKLAKQNHMSHQSFLTKLYNDRHPVIEVIKFSKHASDPLILRLWSADINLQPGNIPLYIGTLYSSKSEKYFFFFRRKMNKIPTIHKTRILLIPKDMFSKWQIKFALKQLPMAILDRQKRAAVITLIRSE